ncbi:MAG: LysR family transcriptional regulator [Alphaproteobacteria bacterium]|nr:LysR family transcriptional regulator [Alphaproteobacteria bacterium]
MGEIAAAMELRSLFYFVRIAELGSITRAAAHLQIAQPALTRHVQRLEDELDAALFTRANRGVRLTEAGEKLLDSAQRILRDVERAGDEIRAHKAHPSGKIILGVTPPLCPVVVPELFARMREHYPLIELKVIHAGTSRLEEFIVAGLVDLALMAMISRSRLIALTRLAEEEMVLVTRPGARPLSFVTVEELNHTPLILGDGMRTSLEVLLAGRGIALRVDTELDDHETIRLMVQQGVGASILPHSSVYRECARGLAQAHRITESGVFRILALGAAESRAPSAARQAVAEVVTDVLGDIEATGKLRPQIPEPTNAVPMPLATVEPALFSRSRGASKRGGGARRQILSPHPPREVSHKSAPQTDKTPAVLSAGQDRSGRNQ